MRRKEADTNEDEKVKWNVFGKEYGTKVGSSESRVYIM